MRFQLLPPVEIARGLWTIFRNDCWFTSKKWNNRTDLKALTHLRKSSSLLSYIFAELLFQIKYTRFWFWERARCTFEWSCRFQWRASERVDERERERVRLGVSKRVRERESSLFRRYVFGNRTKTDIPWNWNKNHPLPTYLGKPNSIPIHVND